MTVERIADGQWAVVSKSGEILAVCATNASAWRKADILAGELLNRAQETSEWISRK